MQKIGFRVSGFAFRAACAAPLLAAFHAGAEEAEALLRTGKYEEAAAAATRAIGADAADAEARRTLALSLLATGKRAEAVEALRPLTKDLPEAKDPDALLKRARARLLLAELTGDAELTKAVIEEELPSVERLDPADARPHVLKARMYLRAAQSHDGIAEAKAAKAKNPDDPDLLLLLGQPERVLARDPSCVEALVDAALKRLFGASGIRIEDDQRKEGDEMEPGDMGREPAEADRKAALAHLDAALKVNPRSSAARAALAAWRYYDGDLEAFEKETAAARAVNPSCGLPYLFASRISENPRDQREAIRWARRAVEADPHLFEGWMALGAHCMNEGFAEEAKRAFERARSLNRFDVKAKNWLTYLNDLAADFEVVKTAHCELLFSKREAPVLRLVAPPLVEGWYGELAKRYGFEPELPVRVEIFDDMQDFAVRGFGLPGAPFMGVCFGRVVINQSPYTLAPQKRVWADILRHEFMHVFSVQMSDGLVSRWFTEGLSTYEERRFRPEWDWEEELDRKIFDAFHDGTLLPVSQLNRGFEDPDRIRMYYYVSSLACEYIDGRFGAEGLSKMMRQWAKGSGARTRAQEMMRGWSGRRDAEVVRAALGIPMEELDRGFREWIGKRLASIRIHPRIGPQALAGLERDAKVRPDDLALLARLARGRFQGGDEKGAEEAARKVADAADRWKDLPDRAKAADALVILGHLAFDKDDYKAAKRHFLEAARLGSEDFHLFFALGKVHEEEDDGLAEAIRWYRRARDAFPRQVYADFDPHRRISDLLQEDGDEEGVIEAVARRCAIVHEDLRMRRWLLRKYLDRRRFADALDVGWQLLYMDPFDARTHLAMAEACAALGKGPERLAALEAGLAARDYLSDPVCGYRMSIEDQERLIHDLACGAAEALTAAGRKDEARRRAGEALAAVPDSARAREILKRLDASGVPSK